MSTPVAGQLKEIKRNRVKINGQKCQSCALITETETEKKIKNNKRKSQYGKMAKKMELQEGGTVEINLMHCNQKLELKCGQTRRTSGQTDQRTELKVL